MAEGSRVGTGGLENAMTNRDREQPTRSLALFLQPWGEETFHPFFLRLQQGFGVRARVGCSIQELLCEQFGLDATYLKQRITTIFLNGKAIDDLETSRVHDGATLALSAAMPGLVGATMRRGGFYAAMRGAMTYNEAAQEAEEKFGIVRIKLFNLLLAELGPGFLRQGMVLPADELAALLAGLEPSFWSHCRQLLRDGEPVEAQRLLRDGLGGDGQPVEFSVLLEE